MKDDNKTRAQLVQELAELRLQKASPKKSESADTYRNLVESLRDVIYELDSQGVVLYISSGIRDLLGFESDEIVGKKFVDLAHKDDLSGLTEWFSELCKGKVAPSEYRMLDKSGGHKWAQTRVRPIMEDGQFKGARGILIDVTETRKLAEALRESEEKYRLTFENVVDVIYVIDANLVVLSVSPSVGRILGYEPQDFVGRPASDLARIFTAESFERAIADVGLILKGETFSAALYQFIAKDGTIKHGEVSGSPVMRGDKIVGIISVARDITERKRAEEALRDSEEKYRWVLNNMADVIAVMDMSLRFTYVSPSITHMRGYTVEEATAQTLEQVMTPASLQISAKAFEEELELEASGTADPDRVRILEVEQYKKDGTIVLMENHLSFMRDEAKKPVGILSVSHDVTQRRRAEEALYKAKTLLDKTFASMEEAIYIVDSDTRRIVACNHATEVIFGFGEKDLIGCSTDVLHVDKSSYDLFGRELFPALDAKGVFRTEFQMRRKDGSVFPTENTVTEILDDSGRRISVVSVVRDITDRRMAEKKLKQTNIFLDSIIENIPNMIFLKDAGDLRFIRLNRAGEDLLGYSREDLLGKSDYDFFPKEQADHFTKKDRDVLNGKELVDIPEESLQTRSQGERTLHTKKVPLLDEKGEPEFLLGISEDITERIKMDENLRERDIQLKKLASWAPGMMYQLTKRPDGTYCVPFTTEAVKDIFGCSPEDIREDFSPISRVIWPEDLKKVIDSIEYSAEHLTIWALEYRVQIPGRSIRWLLGKSTPEKLADGSITWYGFNTDITEIKKAEEALRKSEEEFRSLAESMPQIVWVTRKDGWNIYFNQQWVDYTGLSLEESYGHGWNIPFHPDDKQRARSAWENATKNNGIYSLECRLRRADGVYRWWLVRGVPLLDETGDIVKWFGTCTDIDKIKHAEEQLKETLESLRKSLGATIQVMVSAVEARDPYTAGHQVRVADLARAIATEMGLPQVQIDGLRMAGSIHDIGKLSIPAEILSKPTKLSEMEFSLIKEHAQHGYEILKDVESPWPLAEIVRQHHERMDGSGYPRKLKGKEILIEARILNVADVVEAMASHRPYRPGLGIHAALDEIEKNRGTIYDKTVADACLRLFREKGFKLGSL